MNLLLLWALLGQPAMVGPPQPSPRIFVVEGGDSVEREIQGGYRDCLMLPYEIRRGDLIVVGRTVVRVYLVYPEGCTTTFIRFRKAPGVAVP